MGKDFLTNPVLHIILIVVLCLLAYSNSFSVPFQLDDKDAIAENPIIKDFQYFTSPSKAKAFTEHFGYHTFRSRYIGYLTFALNYSIHGLDTTGYHIVNFFIHICTALLLYLLVHLTFQTPFLLTSGLRANSRQIALVAALLFACHPVQTEAVTYIWQRVASLATMLYLLSLVLYIQWRLKGTSTASISGSFMSIKSIALYLTSLVSAVLAMKTKQIAFTLPVMIALYEFLFFHGKIRRRLLFLLPFALTMPIIPLTLLDLEKPLGDVIGDVSEVSRDLTRMSRLDYLFTQFRVIVTYLRLIVLPINQNLDYDHPLFHSFFTTEVVLSFLLLLTIFCSAMYLLYRSRHSSPHLRIIAFGIFWFFITLSVESSFIPIKEIMFEYRVYLPSVGVFLATSTVVFIVMKGLGKRSKNATKAVTGLLVVLIILLTGATYSRNTVWGDEITMWEDIVSKSPNKGRAHVGLGNAYKSQGLFAQAIEQYNIALRLNPYDITIYNNLGNVYFNLGDFDMAIHYLKKALRFKSNFGEGHYNIANAYKFKGLLNKAIEHYKAAITLKPYDPDAHNNIGNTYQSLGLIDKAIEHYRVAIQLKPDFAQVHFNLGIAYKAKGLIRKAEEHFKIAQKINPGLVKGARY
ncbi:tetratricopeptide repeat protein [bacterium]|nr:MAG: tetratricopeptide repeat protein [bacterium]